MATLRTMNRRRWRKANPPMRPAVGTMSLRADETIRFGFETIRGGRWARFSPRNAYEERTASDNWPTEFDEVHGTDEGHTCERGGCQGVLAYTPSSEREGCTCFRTAPCGYCMSIVPECPTCGWREGEAS